MTSKRTRYKMVSRRDLPIADSQGRVFVHRAIVYDKVGEGPHPCALCGKALMWETEPASRICVVFDDYDQDNLDPDNLSMMCAGCVQRRMLDDYMCINGHVWTKKDTYIRPDKGTKICRVCDREQSNRRRRRKRELLAAST